MKQWLSDNGLEVDSLGKKEVAEMLKTAPAELQKVLLLRQQLAKSSVKKYQAMEKAVCADGVLVECFSSMVPTGPVVGPDALSRCRTCPRTIFRIWQKPVVLSVVATLKAWSFSTKMCRIRSLN